MHAAWAARHVPGEYSFGKSSSCNSVCMDVTYDWVHCACHCCNYGFAGDGARPCKYLHGPSMHVVSCDLTGSVYCCRRNAAERELAAHLRPLARLQSQQKHHDLEEGLVIEHRLRARIQVWLCWHQ